ncbi:MAG: transglycosylase SLT domain-containing protein [Bdellovibrionota bacterium]
MRFLLLLVLVTSACATQGTVIRESDYEPSVKLQEIIKQLQDADAEIDPSPHVAIPLTVNARVERWIEYFSTKDRARFRTFLERGSFYKAMVEQVLAKHGVPRDIFYLGMIESGYTPHAVSRQKAVGIWQFIRGTGVRYGLKVNRYLDERRDVILATEAAARYLSDLFMEFKSWYLAIAAYNAGEGRIRRAIEQEGGTRDFWDLIQKDALPRETVDYVPKFLAAVIIGRNAEKYGFNELNNKKLPDLTRKKVPPQTHLREIARQLNVPYEIVKALNPQLIKNRTPADIRTSKIWLPNGPVARIVLKRNLATRELSQENNREYGLEHAISRVANIHKVRRGETLSGIAKKYGIAVSRLRKINKLQTNRIFAGQRLTVVNVGT